MASEASLKAQKYAGMAAATLVNPKPPALMGRERNNAATSGKGLGSANLRRTESSTNISNFLAWGARRLGRITRVRYPRQGTTLIGTRAWPLGREVQDVPRSQGRAYASIWLASHSWKRTSPEPTGTPR